MLLAHAALELRTLTASARPTIVAVPARDEVERIGACLDALLHQTTVEGTPLGREDVRVIVLANNCNDATAGVARGFGDRVEVLETELPATAANAGGARRAAMEAAASQAADSRALICTTDADSRPRPDWVARLWRALDGGAEAVAGAVDFDPAEAGALRFSETRRLEALYSALQAEITARVDPEAHNPWPNHIWAWGANLAVTAAAYRRVGGLPAEPLAEDRAFVEQLRRHDVPVRHCLDARVWTSARRLGRAAGGLASLVDDHAGGDAEPCDAALQPAHLALRRAAWRRRLRRVYARGVDPATAAARLDLEPAILAGALARNTFGAAWGVVQAASPRLQTRRLQTADLPREIGRAERLLRRTGPADPASRASAASAGLWSAVGKDA